DPRGSEDYNEVLSHYRAISVKEALSMAGVDDRRISVTAHGANRARTELDNADTYTSERRVDIETINPQPSILSMQQASSAAAAPLRWMNGMDALYKDVLPNQAWPAHAGPFC